MLLYTAASSARLAYIKKVSPDPQRLSLLLVAHLAAQEGLTDKDVPVIVFRARKLPTQMVVFMVATRILCSDGVAPGKNHDDRSSGRVED